MNLMALKASYVLKRNIDAILKARGQTRKDLARACGRTEAWLSQIFTKAERELPLKYLDAIAGFFGIAPYQLFHPGISALTERRKGGDRRAGGDRRVSHVAELRVPVSSKAALDQRLNQMSPDAFRRWMVHADAAATLVTREQADKAPHGPPAGDEPPTGPVRRTRRKRRKKATTPPREEP